MGSWFWTELQIKMKRFALIVILFSAMVYGAPSTFQTKRQAEVTEAGDHTDHLFHGGHLWGLGEFHIPAGGSESRQRRQADTDGGDHTDHLFHGGHLWGLQDFHIPAEGSES